MNKTSRIFMATMVPLLLALYAGMVYLTIGTDYRLTVESAERFAQTLGTSLEQHASRTIGEAESVIDLLSDLIEDHHWAVTSGDRQMAKKVQAFYRKYPQIRNAFVITPDGIMYPLSSGERSFKPFSVADSDYFCHYRGSAERGVYISACLKGQGNSAREFTITRPLYRPDGTLQMIVGLTLDLSYFNSYYRELYLNGIDGRVALLRSSGDILMTFPPSDMVSNRDLKDTALFRSYRSGIPQGVFETETGIIDASERIIAYRKLQRYPLVSVISLSRNEVLGPWKMRALKHGSGALLSICVIFLLTWSLLIRLRGLAHTNELLVRQQQELELAAQVFAQSKQSIIITDAEGVIIKCNSYFTQLTGYTPEEAVGKTPRILKSQRHDAAFYTELWRSLRQQGEWKGEIWNRKKNDDGFAAQLSISSVRDKSGGILYYIGMLDDITEQKLSSERIHHLAHYDILTELPNRLFFKDRFDLAIQQAERYQRRLAILFLDLDNFKKVNDTLGHHAGDLLLQTISRRILGCLRKIDLVARLGGDEFAILLEDIKKPADVERITGKLIDAIGEPVDLDGVTVYVGVSIGASIYPDDGNSFNLLSRNADTAMYRAKGAGKNCCCFFNADMAEEVARRLALETELREAIPGQLFVLYQPQADVSDGRIIGVEALVRWRHPTRGLVGPADFIGIAEETGQIRRLGEWVLETACRQAAYWYHEMGISLRVAVNVSAMQLSQQSFFDAVENIIRENCIPPSLLELELTESMLMPRVQETIGLFNRLKQFGVSIAIDDFGTGYSSLAYLKRLPINRLKVDRSFIAHTPDDKEDVAITCTIIAMARSLGLQVTAEGVERRDQLDFLRGEGCDEFQGYILAKPATPAELETLLETHCPRREES